MKSLFELNRSINNRALTLLEGQRESHESLREEGTDEPPKPMGLMAMAAPRPLDLKTFHRKKLLRYPSAVQVAAIKHRGRHVKLYPEGLTVHFNAGRMNAVSTMDSGRKNGYLYDAMGPDGTIYQSNPLDQWGYHEGPSAFAGKKGMSSFCRGIEISSAGPLDAVKLPSGEMLYKPWFYKKSADAIPAAQVRTVKKVANITKAGPYQKYTTEQEESLIQYCLWLKVNNPDVFNFDLVHGHDEGATPRGRKSDPGGALSMTMPEFRALLKDRYIQLMK